MIATTRARLQFLGAASLVYGAAALMARHYTHEPAVAVAALLDIMITVPVLAFFLLVRRGIAKWTLPLLLVAAGMSAGLVLVPDSSLGEFAVWRQDAWVGLRRLMLGVIGGRALLALESWRYQTDQPQPLTALKQLTGSGMLAHMLMQEAQVQRLGLLGWRRRPAQQGQIFTQHQTSSLSGLLITLAALLIAETVGLHLLLSLWNPALAWMATAASLYALVWLSALYQSVRLHPTVLDGQRLTIGAGMNGTVEIGLDQISRIDLVQSANHRQVDYLRGAVMTEANLLIALKYPAMAVDLGGRPKPVGLIGLYVDDPTGLRQAIWAATAPD